MTGTGRRVEGSAETASPERTVTTGSEVREERPLSLIEECESLFAVAGNIVSFRGAVNAAGTSCRCEATPSEDVLRQIIRIVETRALTPRERLAKKTALEYVADEYGDPADIWIILIKGICADLDLMESRAF